MGRTRMAAVYFMVVTVIITQRSWSWGRPLLPISNGYALTRCKRMTRTTIHQQDMIIVQRVLLHA